MLVVWKELNVSPLSDRNRKEANNEIEILSSLNHKNIIKYLNHFVDNDVLCIELEFANGGSLAEKIAKCEEDEKMFCELVCFYYNTMDEYNVLHVLQDVLWYFYQLMLAVSYIHNIGVIHR